MTTSYTLPRLQFITGSNPRLPHADEVRQVCEAGVRFIQFREKHASVEGTKRMAETALAVAQLYDALFIVNDYLEVAEAIGAHGVHVGYDDASPAEAREKLGSQAIIGGTGNTFDHVQQLYQQGVDYMGIGPFRHTDTKDQLKPLLGLKGYETLSQKMQETGINTPVYAVGGLMAEDVSLIQESGVSGVAVSSAIGATRDLEAAAKTFLQEIEHQKQW